MATKFLKAQNGGIYKDSTGKPIAVEPERVIRDIEGNIPASTLEDISVSTGTASTNGVTYIRAQMKGEVTYTDNTTDTIQYNIDLPIKAGDGVTIEAQPLEGGTDNKQLVISASGGGGTTLNKYVVSRPSIALIRKTLLNAKGLITGRISLSINGSGYMYINPSSIATSETGELSINAVTYARTTPNPSLFLVTGSISATSTSFTGTHGVAINMGDFSMSMISSLSYFSDPSILIYYNDTEITA